jgi:hypothetical protein
LLERLLQRRHLRVQRGELRLQRGGVHRMPTQTRGRNPCSNVFQKLLRAR